MCGNRQTAVFIVWWWHNLAELKACQFDMSLPLFFLIRARLQRILFLTKNWRNDENSTGGRDENIDFWRILTKFAKFNLFSLNK